MSQLCTTALDCGGVDTALLAEGMMVEVLEKIVRVCQLAAKCNERVVLVRSPWTRYHDFLNGSDGGGAGHLPGGELYRDRGGAHQHHPQLELLGQSRHLCLYRDRGGGILCLHVFREIVPRGVGQGIQQFDLAREDIRDRVVPAEVQEEPDDEEAAGGPETGIRRRSSVGQTQGQSIERSEQLWTKFSRECEDRSLH